MAVKKGYKQTEVGSIPEEWNLTELVSCASRITDGEHLTPIRTSSGYYLLSARNVLNGRIDVKDVDYVGYEEYQRIRRRCDPEPGDVLISCSGTIGRVATVPSGFQCVMVRSAALIKPNNKLLNGLYAQYSLQYTSVQKQILVSLNQGAQANLFLNHIQKLLIPLPTLTEQEAIAGALSDADEWIESLEQLIAKKRQIKQGAMQELLTGKRRLPGFSGEWETKRLGDVADVKTGPFGSALHEGDYKSTGTPIITVEHLGEFGVEHVNLPLVSDSDCQRLRAYTLELGDIVFSRVGSVDRNALIRPEEVGWLFSGRLLRVRLKCKRVSSPFLSYQFHGESFISSVRNVAVGQTMACLNTQILKGILIRLPSIEEQTAIASVLFDMDTEIKSLEAKLAKAREVKQGMMQELLTGRIRLA